MSKDWKAK